MDERIMAGWRGDGFEGVEKEEKNLPKKNCIKRVS